MSDCSPDRARLLRRAIGGSRPAALIVAALLTAGLAACGHNSDSGTTSDRSSSDNNSRSASDRSDASPSTIAVSTGPVILRTTPPPWNPPGAGEEAKAIAAAGLPYLRAEGQVQHTHTHLDVIIDGQQVTVPRDIGFDLGVEVLSAIHTHDDSGIIHVESPTLRSFTLGQFFTQWEVRLTASCVGATCANDRESVKFYVDGEQFSGDPNNIVLRSHQEIAIVAASTAGGADGHAAVPSTYNFPSGY